MGLCVCAGGARYCVHTYVLVCVALRARVCASVWGTACTHVCWCVWHYAHVCAARVALCAHLLVCMVLGTHMPAAAQSTVRTCVCTALRAYVCAGAHRPFVCVCAGVHSSAHTRLCQCAWSHADISAGVQSSVCARVRHSAQVLSVQGGVCVHSCVHGASACRCAKALQV